MKNKLQNLFSRKFLLTAIIVIAGIGTSLKSIDDAKAQVAGIIIAGLATIIYNVVEGHIDAVAVGKYIQTIIDEVEKIEESPEDTDNKEE